MMSGCLRVFLVGFLLGPAWANAIADSFVDEVVALARRQFPSKSVSKSKDGWTVNIGDARLGLDNLRRNCSGKRARSEREGCILEALKALGEALELPTTWEEARPRIRPQLVHKDYLAAGASSFVCSASGLSEELLACMAIDSERTLKYVSKANLEAWKVGEEALRTAGFANLEAASKGLDLDAREGGGGNGRWLAVQERDGYSAVRILLPSLRRRIAAELGSPFFMGVPNRGFLVCWSGDFGKADDFIAQVANDFEARPHPLSPAVFVVDDRGIRPYEAPAKVTNEVRGARIVEHGVYEDVAEIGTKGAEKSTAGHVTAVLDMKLVAATERVPRKLHTNFGMRFVLEGEPAGATEQVTIRVLHPPFRKPGVTGDTRSDEWEATGIVGKTRYTGWEFEYPYELVPGRWTIQIVHEDRVLAENAFTVE